MSRSLTARVLTPEGMRSVDVELSYDPSCPYAVTATFLGDGAPVSWTFARDLLILGQYEPVGSGDVHIRPEVDDAERAAVLLELRSPGGIGVAMLPAMEVNAFVEASTETVRPGAESDHLDIDAAVHAVLVGEAGPGA